MPTSMVKLSAVLDVITGRHALGNERFDADGGTVIRNRSLPLGGDANHVADITAATALEIDRMLERADREFEGILYRRFDVTPISPPAVEARLALEGYSRLEFVVSLLEDQLKGVAPASPDIRLVESDADWEALLRLSLSDGQESQEKEGASSWTPEFSRQHVQGGREKSGQLHYWLAYADGVPVAHCSSWGGIGGVGMVEDLFTLSDYRHRGIATALIHHCVSDCREHDAEAIVILAEFRNTSKDMYAAMGFSPQAVVRSYRKPR